MRHIKSWIRWGAFIGLVLNTFVVVSGQEKTSDSSQSDESKSAQVAEAQAAEELDLKVEGRNAEDEELNAKQLSILFAKTNLQLAELELKRALSMNEKRLVIPKAAVERLRSNLAVAKEQYRRARSDAEDTADTQNPRLRHAVERVRLAKVDLTAAEELKTTNAISDWEFRRLKLKYDLAQLNLALMRHPRGYLTLLDQMQYQIDSLGEEFLALEQRIARLETVRP